MLKAIPTSLIKSYVGGIQKLVDEVSKIRIDKSTIEGIIKPLNLLSSAIDGIANINLTRAMIGLVKFKIFSKVLMIAFKGAASPEATKNLKQLSAALSPLEKIGESLTAFANIKWVKTLLSVKALKLFLGSLSKLPIEIIKKFTDVIKKIASGIVKPMKLISDSIGYFGEKLGKVSGALIKGALGILALSASIIPLAYGLKMLKGIELKSVAIAAGAITLLTMVGTKLGKNLSGVLKGALGIAALSAAIIPLAYSLNLLKDIDLKSVTIAGVALGGLALAASALGKNMGMVLKGTLLIAALGASIIPLAYSLKMIQGVKWETLGIVATAITGLGLAAVALGIPAVAGPAAIGALVIAGLGAALIPLAYSLKMIQGVKWETLGIVAAAITGLGLAAVALGIPAVAGLALIGAAVIAVLGAALIPLAYSLKKISEVDPKALYNLGPAIASLGMGLLKGALGLALGGIALIPFSLGVLALGAATALVGDGLGDFFEKFTLFSDGLDPAKIYNSAVAITALALAIAGFGAAQAAEGLGNLVGKLLRFGSDSPLEQFQKFAAIGESLKSAGEGVLNLSKGIASLAGLGDEIEALDEFPIDKIEKIAKATSTNSFSNMSNEQKASAAGYGSWDEYEKAKFAWKGKDKFSKMSKEEKAAEAGYKSYDEYEKAKFAWKGKDNIQTIPPTTGNMLATAGNISNVSPTIVVNNNSGGNVSNVSSSNVNNNAAPMMPIVTGSAMGY